MHNSFRLSYAALARLFRRSGHWLRFSRPVHRTTRRRAECGWRTLPMTQCPNSRLTSLLRTAPCAPAVRLITGSDCGTGLVLDASGNMWESDLSTDVISEYSPAARNAGGAATPTATITSTALGNARPMSFDSRGNLWVSNCEFGILEFTAAQVTAAGTQTPNVVITPGRDRELLLIRYRVQCQWERMGGRQ